MIAPNFLSLNETGWIVIKGVPSTLEEAKTVLTISPIVIFSVYKWLPLVLLVAVIISGLVEAFCNASG